MYSPACVCVLYPRVGSTADTEHNVRNVRQAHTSTQSYICTYMLFHQAIQVEFPNREVYITGIPRARYHKDLMYKCRTFRRRLSNLGSFNLERRKFNDSGKILICQSESPETNHCPEFPSNFASSHFNFSSIFFSLFFFSFNSSQSSRHWHSSSRLCRSMIRLLSFLMALSSSEPLERAQSSTRIDFSNRAYIKDHSCRVYVPRMGARADDRFDFRLICAKETQIPHRFSSFPFSCVTSTAVEESRYIP